MQTSRVDVEQAESLRCSLPLKPLIVALSLCVIGQARAACDNTAPASGTTVTCTGTDGAVAAQAGSTGVTVNVAPGATVSSTRSSPNAATISVDTASTITNAGAIDLTGTSASGRGAAMLGANDGNTLVNTSTGVITTTGASNDGMASNGNGGTLVNHGAITVSGPNAFGMTAAWGQSSGLGLNSAFTNTGTITANGSGSRAISVVGGQSTVTNSGTLVTTGGTASNRSFTVFMQGNNNQLTNSGYIEARGVSSDAVVSNTAQGFTSSIVNQAGGQIISRQGFGVRTVNGTISITNAGLIQSDAGTAIAMNAAARSNTLTLQTGSQIIGTADGGASAVSRLILQGTGTASNAFVNFGTLLAQGDNWTWTGSGNFTTAQLQSGVLDLRSTLGGAATTVASGATLTGTGTLAGNVTNAGTVHPGDGAGNGTLTIAGGYTGQNGTLAIDTALGNDASRVAPLTVSGGAIGGSTTLVVNNLNGLGALTTGNGIPVVNAVGGATSAASALTLGGPVSAGAYSYFLYKGGTTPDSTQSWFLRSTVPAATTATVLDPASGQTVSTVLTPVAASGSPAVAAVGEAPAPIYRVAVPVYSEMPEVARAAGFAQMGTFHERQGQQGLLTEKGWLTSGWARVWGQTEQLRAKGDVSPQFDGNIGGVQLGHDLFARRTDGGHSDHVGILGGWTRASGDVQGFALGTKDMHTGSLGLDMYSGGLYWTHVMPGGAYTDAVFLASSLQYESRPVNGVNRSTHGTGLAASLETGWPIALTPTLSLEPQAQLIWQRQSLNDLSDDVSTVSFANTNSWLARVGARLEANYDGDRGLLRPYLLFNLLHRFGNDGRVVFGGTTPVVTSANSTAAQFGIGVAGRFNRAASVYATLAYLTQLDSTRQQSVSATLGLRWTW
ncbi:autotransporter outer membrane beta-barrel domain-containing protein [Pandoraea nosoerga]|uniref:Autotransporter n=1 Tax=Pandoraea nosoerga TaxID=2508296 RepID=A0A5E4SVJ2_9BURK|nr:autotransporter outer membrane beta-barrel domain-containing protein [Pandoraea nosoerga]MBN4666450.1 autotransporter outer membrane beta-barrel domain-containing protein [Pandoraea nosoerga]MBN4677606.1 autotransporter outer membrane beta-barrel domain-containing protein [Pandoraea nosoerga]MBN4682528.1 autotransporter outer membrane beta-barrel domain-containing protein [Pandoraea nosoerga]MBN4745610.1 autotransporter outer membrane beta-barrel domain-containing protein [Pandoraea nosoerga